MRYDDQSQGDHNLSAHDDYDVIKAGTGRTATGNAITGRGTVSGAAGADDTGNGGAHVTAITGAGGGQGASMEAAGRYGSIKIDGQGNYTYTRNQGSPENVEDVFTYTLADKAGMVDSARLIIRIEGKEDKAEVQANAQRVVAGTDLITLPAGVQLSDIHVVGRDLVITLPDGGQMVIVDGAVFVPQLALGDVAVPSDTLAALLIDSEPRPAAGPPQSSGGNFAVPVAPLDPGVPLGDLLPPTELSYTPPTFKETYIPLVQPDNIPEIFIQPDGQPAAVAAVDAVDEAGLPARPGEPAGSNSAANSEFANGNIVFTSPDGVATITITVNGTAYVVYGTGAVTDIPGDYGTLHINSVNIAAGTISYTYTLLDNVNHATDSTPYEDFSVTLVDTDGDPATATLRINIADDMPHANADVDSVVEDGVLVADGNVFTGVGGTDANATDGVADVQGADGAHVSGFSFGGTAGTFGVPLNGMYGELVLGSDGSYKYTLHNSDPAVQALKAGETRTDVYTYTITDGDGNTSTTTLTITVTGTNDRPVLLSGSTSVTEEAFVAPHSPGNPDNVGNPTDNASAATSSGNLSLSDPDGDALTVTLSAPAGSFTSHGAPVTWSVSADGHTLTGSANGSSVIVVTIDNAGHYTVNLLAQLDHPITGTTPATSEDILSIVVPVHANDGSVTVDGSLTVNVEDDSPIINGEIGLGAGVDIDESNSGTPVLSPAGAITVTSAGAIISAPVSYGGDGPGGAPAYSITLNDANSGLLTADGDHPITLVQVDATHINGVFNDGADKVAFSITINANGSITVTQNYALEHSDDGNTPIAYNDTNSPLTLSGLITAHVVYEDYDHDTVSASANIGQLIRFFDDGPSVQVSVQLPAGQALDGLALVTSDDGTEGPGSTSDSTTANFGGAFSVMANGGADGLASSGLTFDLSLLGGSGPIDSGLTSHGQVVYLFQLDANTIIAATSMTAVGAGDPSAVFALQTNDSGIVTLTQYQQIDHPAESPSGAPFADQSVALDPGLIALVGTGSAVDNDGDYANDVKSLDLGGLVRFVDDGPAISVSLNQGASLHIDESVPGTDGPGETDAVGLGQVTVALSSLLTVTDVQVSADSPTTYGYALLLGPAKGGLVDSGLMTSDGNHPIYLYNVGGVIVGSTATDGNVLIANTVFTVELSGGNVVMTQYQAIEHADTTSFDENSSPLALGSLLLQVTATDFDHDTDVKTVDLGSIITFGDDGPNAVDHTLPGTQPEGANVVIDVTADIDGGSDGLDHVEIVSKTGTGSLSYDPVTHQFTYVPAAGESGPISFVYRVFDKDGDHDDATVSFTLEADSKPTVSVQDLTVDEKGLPLGTGELANPAPDTDNSEMASGSMTISTGNDSLGAVEVQDKDGNWINVTGATVATPVIVQGSHGYLSVVSDGAGHYSYTYTLTAPYDHPDFDPNDGDGIRGADDPIAGDNFAVRVSDNEGDTTTVTPATTINVTVLDDAPIISGAVNNAGAVVLDESATSSLASTISLTGITKGDDPDVSGSGAIAKAVGSASIVTPTVTYGADGPHAAPSLLYALSIQNAASGLKVTDGSSINLVMNGDVLVGVVSGGTFNGQAAFAIAIDPTSGVLTVEQYLSLQHPDTTNPDDPVSMLAGHIGVTVTAIDGDNDHVSANLVDVSTKITFEDDGPSVSGSVNANGAVVLDETATSSIASTITLSIAKGDDPDVGGTGAIAKAVGGAAIVSAAPVYGADGQGAPLSYVLSIQNATSGLKVTDGSSINLVMDGNTIVGVVSGGSFNGQAAFAIAIDPATGVLTVEQYLSLQHPDATNPDDPVSMLAGHIAVTVTATDGDGDHASTAAIDISSRITFEDDGPSISANLSTGGAVTLDESATSSQASTISLLGITKGDDPDVSGTGAIAKAVGNSSIVSWVAAYGADGPHAAPSLNFALSIQNASSGLKLTDGTAINLVMNNNSIVGVVASGPLAGQAAFAIAIDPTSGVLTVEQYLSLQHPDTTNPDDPVSMLAGHIGVTVTATDGDNDAATSSAVDISTQVTFKDDGPSISGSVNNAGAVILDESATSSLTSTITLSGISKGDDPDVGGTGAIAKAVGGAAIVSATPVYGADGQGAALSYALSIQNGTSGLKVTDGSSINLVMNGNVVVGVVSGGSFNGQAAFAIAIDPATGVLTVEQYLSLQHPDTTNPDDPVSMLAGHIGVTVTATDGDGDKASTSAIDISTKVTFEDDGPSISGSANANGAVTLDESATSSLTSTISLTGITKGDDPDVSGSGAIAKAVGGASVVTATPAYGADGQGAALSYVLSIQNAASGLTLTDGSAINLVMNGTTVVGVVASGTFAGQAAFAIAIDPTSGVLTVEQYLSLHHPDATNPDDAVSMTAGHIAVTVTATDGDGDKASTSAIDISNKISFEDDGPSVSASLSTGGAVTLDESTSSSLGSTITLVGITKGDDPDISGTGAIAKATGNSSIVSWVVNYGADGPHAAPALNYALSIQNASSGLTLTDGTAINLVMNNNSIVGVVASGPLAGQAAFAIAIDSSTGVLTVEQYLSLNHPDATNPDDSVNMLAGHIGVTVTATDGDNDTATSGLVDISTQVKFEDSGPIMTGASNINIQNADDVAHTGTFAYFLGSDGPMTDNNVFKAVTGSATVNGNAVSNYSISESSENATTAIYNFSFDYPTGTGGTAHETGTLTFDKVAGTYTVDLDTPIAGFSVLATAGAPASAFINYNTNGTTSNGPSPIATVQLANNFYIQFTGDSSGSHTTVAPDGTFVPTTGSFAGLELFTGSQATVTVSSSAAGVAGNTLQGGEVLDFNLYSTDPMASTGIPTQSATSMFIELDGVGSSEDMIVVLKLYDTVTHQYTSVALMVQNGDIIKSNATLAGTPYAGITLDNNDGLVVIEANDYQQGNTNLVIVGAQIAGSDAGITGTAINLNGAVGDSGGSSGTQPFSTDVNDNPFKIQNIGFLTTTTTNQNASLTFNVTIQDGDGDSITQAITATVTSSADSSTPIALSPSVTTVTPVVIDTDHDGVIGFLSVAAGVTYDMNGDGHLDNTAWVAPGDSILFFDADGNGTVSGANEFVFGHDGMTDLEALHAMYGDQLDANDAAFTMFGLWNDANSNGIVDAGEVQTLAEAGITSISLVSDGVVTYEAGGDVAVNGSGTYTYVNDNGDQVGGKLADASFRFQAQSAELEQRIATNATNASLLAIAAAAAGLAEQVAASTPVADDNHRVAPEPVVNVTPTITPETVIDDSSDPQVSPLVANDDAKVVEAAPAAHHNAVVVEQSNIIIDSAGHDDSAPQALPQGSDGPMVDMTPLIDVAPLTVMAEASPADVDGAKHHAVVASQIIEQPDTTVDQILAKVAGNAAIESLAQVQSGPKAVQGWDTADFGHLPAAIIEHIVADASLLHPDAVQPVMHG